MNFGLINPSPVLFKAMPPSLPTQLCIPIFKKRFIFNNAYISVWGYVHMNAGTCRG